MTLAYRSASLEDLPPILLLYQDAVAAMRQAGIDQWDELYPSEAVLRGDIGQGEMYLGLIADDIAAVFTLNGKQDPEYAGGRWQYPELPFAVVHRLCVNPRYRGQGLGRAAMEQAESLLKAQGYGALRLDAFSQNPTAIKLYEGLGYTKTGQVTFRKGLFYLYEKKL